MFLPGDAEGPDDLALLEPLRDELSNVVHVEVLVRRGRAVQGQAGDAGRGVSGVKNAQIKILSHSYSHSPAFKVQ